MKGEGGNPYPASFHSARRNGHQDRPLDPLRPVRSAGGAGDGGRPRGRRHAPHRHHGRALRAERHDGPRVGQVDPAADEGPVRRASDGHPSAAVRESLRRRGRRRPDGPRGERSRRPRDVQADPRPRDRPGTRAESRHAARTGDAVPRRGGFAPRDDGPAGLLRSAVPCGRRAEDPRGPNVHRPRAARDGATGRWRDQGGHGADRRGGGGGHPRVGIRDFPGPHRGESEGHPGRRGEGRTRACGASLKGQELFVKSVKTPKRTPTRDQLWASSDKIDLGLGVPGWAIASVTAMVGFTHEDMGQVAAWLERWTGSADDLGVLLRQYGNAGQSNNFTSYDLLQKPSSGSQLAREDLVLAGRTWYVKAYDSTINKVGAAEYLQIQVTVHTLPNRADTDADGLNDSEEMNLGSDGFRTDPWKADTDGDTLPDTEYTTRGTSPVLADTDRDGVRDDVDRVPLGDAFVTIEIVSAKAFGSDDDGSTALEPFLSVEVGGQTAYTAHPSVNPGSTAYYYHLYNVNVPDDQDYASITIKAWDYDSDDVHDFFEVSKTYEHGAWTGDVTWSFVHPLASTEALTYTSSGLNSMRLDPITVTVQTVVP